MHQLALAAAEVAHIQALLDRVMTVCDTADNPGFLQEAGFLSRQLPPRLVAFYHQLRVSHEHTGMTLVTGFPFEAPCDTPPSWNYAESYRPRLAMDFLAVLASACLGHVFGWSTQQKGKIVHDLIPQPHRGGAQTSYGSTSELLMHTEDSFHDFRADFVCMYGIRNRAAVPTTLASMRELEIPPPVQALLFEAVFPLKPDETHLDSTQQSDGALRATADEATGITTLYGDRAYPFLRYDPAYTDFSGVDPAALQAYDLLRAEIERKTHDTVIAAGDLCLIDNRKVVHGRRPFEPAFDGQDRWLKRINITTNLRKSAASRAGLESRVIG